MTEKELRRLLEKIEVKYLHLNRQTGSQKGPHTANSPIFKLTASQKYVEVCTDLVNTVESFCFDDLDIAFSLIVKPASAALDYLKDKKDPDALDVFLLKTIELFQAGSLRAQQANQAEHAHKCRLMCIDVHKLRLLAFDGVDEDALQFTLNYLNEILEDFPFDGRFWFQHAIIQFSFVPEFAEKPVKSFKSLNSLWRALLARQNPTEPANIVILLDKRITVDFSNTLLNLALNDFRNFTEKDIHTWSFVKYFQSFSAGNEVDFELSELAALLLFVVAFFKVSRNSFHLRIFFESFLSARNRKISDFWPFAVFSLLQLTTRLKFEISDAIWFKIFQLLRSESFSGQFTLNSSHLIQSTNFKSFFIGTELECHIENDSLSHYDFDEEFSIERENVINCILEYFNHETGPLKQFITMRSDRTLRLGSHFCEQESDDEHAKIDVVAKKEQKEETNLSELDDSIEILRNKLANMSSNAIKEDEPIDFLTNTFIIDTNVLLSGSPAIRSALQGKPERFLIPLVVLMEISKLCESSEKSSYAQSAWDFLQPLLTTDLRVYNSYGRLLRPNEINQQISILALNRALTVNDDQIILLAIQFHEHFPDKLKPIIITEDINMRLKAKTKLIRSISIKEFRNICNC